MDSDSREGKKTTDRYKQSPDIIIHSSSLQFSSAASITMSSSIKDEIDAAFAAGAMPPEWRPRLLASPRLGERDVDRIAASIAEIHWNLQLDGSTQLSVACVAFWFVVGVLVLCVAGLFFLENDYMSGPFAVVGAVPCVVITPIVTVAYERRRRRAKMLMVRTRTVLEHILLPPI
uniref:Transmembrane protein n=1 Tax=Oryza rufipogon TaxID=4529 RepID=A0A0E0QUC5_ORYRU